MTKELNSDILILKLFINNIYYNKYKLYINNYLINNYKNNNKILYKLYRCLALLHEELDTPTFEDLYLRLLREYPALPVDEREIAQETLQKASGAVFNEQEASTYVQRQYEASRASEIALKAISVAEGKADFGELSKLADYEPLNQEIEKNVFLESTLQELFQTTAGSSGLRWPLESLNKTLGSLRSGDFGFLFARPESGKTTFLAHLCMDVVRSSGQRVVWVNNEEGGNKVLLRCYQSALGITSKQLFDNISKNEELFKSLCGDRFKLCNDPGLHKGKIETLIKEQAPVLVVIDQLDKVLGFEGERYDLLMKAKYQWAREIAKKYNCAVIGVCQAGGTAENKKKLEMTDVDSSHTAKQGEADFILGIGKVNAEGYENVRYINILKNKLVGDKDTVPDLRHGFFDVLIEPEIGRYKDRMDWKNAKR